MRRRCMGKWKGGYCDMKAILLSVQPEWVAKILNGEKTIELRKSVPQGFVFVGWVYIYCTKGKPYLYRLPTEHLEWFTSDNIPFGWVINKQSNFNGKVVARFWLKNIDSLYPNTLSNYLQELNEILCERACLTNNQMLDYSKGKQLYAWHIKSLEIFDKPMELGEFGSDYVVTHSNVEDYGDYVVPTWEEEPINPLTRAPQSWQYVWVKE